MIITTEVRDPTIDIAEIRQMIEAGLDSYWKQQIAALCDVAEQAEQAMAILSQQPHAIAGQSLPEAVQELCERLAFTRDRAAMLRLLTAARAWAKAITEYNVEFDKGFPVATMERFLRRARADE